MCLQLYDIIKPGVVAWSRVHRKFNRMRKFMEKLENCNYAVDLGRWAEAWRPPWTPDATSSDHPKTYYAGTG